MRIIIFLNHFNPYFLFDRKRNGYNSKHHNLLYHINTIILWFLFIPIKLLELFGFFYLFDIIRNTILTSRPLTEFEILESKKVFGENLPYSKIRVRTNSKLAKKGAKYANKNSLAFVLFRCVNFSIEINCENNSKDMSWLIHELVHIKQYEKLGVEYIILALRAQRNGGYEYGGEKTLLEKHPLKYYNLEQQADIIKFIYLELKNNPSNSSFSNYITQLQEGMF